ncbi:MAG TPA: ABC transporter permease [Candidatus Blautia faecigallinarum]|uniref:ABC transporter permease n=1 Tax=Candidatus Blautia faecigallinarum TaxID=2838488 RepID=A0A9D2ISK7_9FIRM|nr:ABC transporter permease [Candidatus Blautia faecigallinarum]
MKQFMTVLKFELNNYFKNKSFLVTTLFLAVLLVGVIVVPTFFLPGLTGGASKGEETEQTEETSQEQLGIFVNTTEIADVDSLLAMIPGQWSSYEDEESLRSAVEAEEIEAGFVLNGPSDAVYVVNNLTMSENLSQTFSSALAQYQKQTYLKDHGLSPEEIAQADSFSVNLEQEVLGKDGSRNYWYTYVLVFVIYMLILFYGQMIAVSITTEKSNRAIEILVTSVNPNSLIFGKVLAGAIAGVLQMVVIIGAGFGAYRACREAWGGMLDFLFQIPGNVMASFVVFGLLSYLLYAFIFGMLGAMVSKTEDISKSATPVTLIYVASFLIAMVGLTDSDSLLMKVASFVPFTSGNAMFIRVSMGSVALWEVGLSVLLLVIGCVAAGILAAKIFRFGTLHYGNPIKLTKALKSMGQQ